MGALVHGVLEAFYVLHTHTKHSASTTIEIIALTLEKVKEVLDRRGVPMPAHLHIQLDNTSRENKNAINFAFSQWLLTQNQFEDVTVEFMEVGHTHIDVDQRFSRVGGVVSHAPVLETNEDFANLIRLNYEPMKGTELYVHCIDAVRDWKSWLSCLNFKMTGHTGKQSAHSLRFIKHENMPDEWKDQPCDSLDDIPPSSGDIILLTKGFMRDLGLLQPPQVSLRCLQTLPDPTSLGIQSCREGGASAIKEYRKTAGVLSNEPWNLTRAANYLEKMCSDWEAAAWTVDQLAPLSFIFQPRASYEYAASMKDWCSVSLVPIKPSLVTQVRLRPTAKGKAKAKAKPAVKAKAKPPPLPAAPHAAAAVLATAPALAPAAGAGPAPVLAAPSLAKSAPAALAGLALPLPPPAPKAALPIPAAAAHAAAKVLAALAPKAPAVPAKSAGGTRRRRAPSPPGDMPLGCAKCRRISTGCTECRGKARIQYSPTRGWYRF